MPNPKQDFLNGCNNQGMSPNEFQEMFCVRCKNPDCVNARWGDSMFAARIATQEERLLRPQRADPNSPKYAQILKAEFVDMLQQAMRLEIADRRGDWSIPPEIPILDGQDVLAQPAASTAVDDAVRALSNKPQTPQKPKEPEVPKRVSDLEPVPLEPVPVPRQVAPGFRMPTGNIPVPSSGVMVDGSTAPPVQPVAEVDPWAIPDPGIQKVAVGAKVKMGSPAAPKESK